MKTFTKILSVFLSILMILYLVPSFVYAQTAEDIASLLSSGEDEAPILGDGTTELYALGEDTSMRTENAKYIRMSDGSYYVAMYENAVHYLDENDVWQEIDNTLSASGAQDADDYEGVEAANGNRSIKFAQNSNAAGLLTIKEGSYKIRFSLAEANKSKAAVITNPSSHAEDATTLEKITEVKKGVSSVLYEDILDGVDLEYVVIGNSVKENLIVKEKAESYVYTFDMRLNKLCAELTENGEIVLKDETSGEAVYLISLPFMTDANGAVSTEVRYTLTQTKNKEYRITVTADAAWINEDGRTFPVTIDPPIEIATSAAADTYVYEAEPNAAYGGSNLASIGYLEENAFRYYWKLSDLPDIPQNSIITSAAVSLYQYTGNLFASNVTSSPICVYEITGSWNENITWNTQPMINSTVVDYQMVSADTEESYITWDITRIAKKWYYGAENKGLSFRTMTESGSSTDSFACAFLTADDSSLTPIFTVTYRNSAGIEDYYTYHTQSVGRAGTGYLHDYTSQLTLVRTDITAESTVMPFTISHIYNDAYAGQMFTESTNNHVIHTVNFASMTMGYGWKLSVQETVVPMTIGEELYYVYNDSDGTEHYFGMVNNTYTDEDGLGLTLSVSGNQYTMTDKMDNQKIFVNGILYKIIDANGNTVRMVYNGSGGMPMANGSQLQKVERYLNGHLTESTAETLATFEYDNWGHLVTMIDLVGRETTFLYTGNQLTMVIYPDEKTMQYTYTDNILTSAYDGEAKYGVEYSLYTYPSSTSPDYNWKTVRYVKEYYVGDYGKSYGQELEIENIFGMYTRYTDQGNDDSYYTQDDVITTYCFDTEGRTTGVYSTNGNYDRIYGASSSGYTDADGTSGKKNRIDSFGVTGALPQNLLTDGSAESASAWTASGSGAVRTTSKKHTGDYALSLTSSSASASEVRFYQASDTLYYGYTYTVSAYVDVSGLNSISSDGGVYLKASNSTETHIGQKLNFNLTSELYNKWQRISLTFSPEYVGSYTISVCLQGAVGTVYIDDIQLEKNPAPSTYNLAGGIDTWERSTYCTETTYADEHGSRSALQLLGAPGRDVYAQQTIPVGKSAKTTFIVSAWAAGYSVPYNDGETFSLIATIVYTDDTSESVAFPFQSEIWGTKQFISGILVPSAENENKTIDEIVLTASYKDNCNSVYIYDIALVEEEVQTYSYDDNGNLTAANQTDTSTISSFYDNLNNMTSTSQNNQVFVYPYKTSGNNHILEKVEIV